MKISHLAIWTTDLEGMRNFYIHYFDASSGEAYLTTPATSNHISSPLVEIAPLN